MYLQTVFELNVDDHVATVVAIASNAAPLSSRIVMPYCRFLVAMDRRLLAQQTLRDLLDSCSRNDRINWSTEDYRAAAEMLVLQLLLPDEGIKAAEQFVVADKVLDDPVKVVRATTSCQNVLEGYNGSDEVFSRVSICVAIALSDPNNARDGSGDKHGLFPDVVREANSRTCM